VINLNRKRDAKKLIVNALREHPEGLMLKEIAKITGMNRLTVAKYVHELMGNGSIFQKEAAAAKICYLRERLLKSPEELLEGIKGRVESEE
jgi:predicted transcriptional regulator